MQRSIVTREELRRLLLKAIHERGMTMVIDVTIRVVTQVPPKSPNWKVPRFEAPGANLTVAEAIVWDVCREFQGKYDVSAAS